MVAADLGRDHDMSEEIAQHQQHARREPARPVSSPSAQAGQAAAPDAASGDEQFLDVRSLTAISAVLKFLKVDDIETGTLDFIRIKGFDVKADKVDVDAVEATTLTASSVAKSASVETGELRAATGRVSGSLTADQLEAKGVRAERIGGRPIDGATAAVVSRAQAIALDDPAAPTVKRVDKIDVSSVQRPGDPAGVVRKPVEPSPGPLPGGVLVAIPPRLALFHDFGKGHDELVLNHLGRYRGGVRIVGEGHVAGALTEAAPRSDTAGVQPLAVADARRVLADLRAVSAPGADTTDTRRLGVLADRLPSLLAQREDDRIRVMDIVALLVTVVQDQQRRLDALAARSGPQSPR
jgi:hypothetical protein